MKLADISLSTRITVLGLLLVVAGGALWASSENQRIKNEFLAERESTLDGALHVERERLLLQMDTLRRDALFLSNTPPISGIQRAIRNGGIDPRERNSRQVWERRLQEIFQAYLTAHPEYIQASYIGLADGGRELVRVNRIQDRLAVVPSSALQRKGDMDYLKAGKTLSAGDVLLSDFTFNQENGRLEVSHRVTLRALVPVFDERGQRFGMLVLNMDANHLLAPMVGGAPKGASIYVSDSHGRKLLSPDGLGDFSTEPGILQNDIRKDFPVLKAKFEPHAGSCAPLRQTPDGAGGYLAAERVHFDRAHPERFLLLVYHVPQQVLDLDIAGIPRSSLVVALLLTMFAAMAFMLALRFILRPLSRITQAASEIAERKHIPHLREEYGGDVGHLVRALNSMMDTLSGHDVIERENAFRKEMVESLPGAFYMIGANGRFLMVNRNFETVLGLPEGVLTGTDPLDLFEGEDKVRIASRIGAVFEQGEATAEAGLCATDGRRIPYQFTGRRIILNGEPVLVGLGLDVSSHHEQLRLIETQLHRNQALMRNSMEGIHVMDIDGNVLEVNDAFCRMLGYTPEEAMKLNVRDWDDQFTSDELAQRFQDLVGKSATFETMHRCKDGKLIQVEVCSTGVEINGKVYLYAASRDITERKRAESVLQRHHVVIETAMDGFWLTDLQGNLEEVNEAYARLSGYTEQELVGMHISQLEAVENPDDTRQHIEKIMREGYDRFETKHRRKDGVVLDIEIAVTLMPQEQKLFVFCRDISESKQHALRLQQQQQMLNEAQRLGKLGSWEFEVQSGVLIWSDEAYRILELDKAAVTPSYELFLSIIHPQDREKLDEAYQRSLREGIPYDIEHRILFPDGRLKWVREHCTTTYDETGEPMRSVGMMHDITARKLDEEQLRVAAATFETHDAIVITDAQSNILRVNNAFTQITGYRSWEVVGMNPRVMSSGRHDQAFYQEMWQQLLEHGTWAGEIWDRRKNGEIYPKWMTITAVKDEAGSTVNYVAIFSDITERKRSEDEIRGLAFYDALTQLPNRRLFMDRLHNALAVSARNADFGALLFIDLDRFKVLNDTLGHDYGDLLLIEVAERIKHCVREIDTVARLGGDEFVVVLEGIGDHREEASHKAGLVAEKIRESLALPYQLKTHEHYSSPSIGVELFHNGAETSDDLIKHADVAMYQAKHAGRNTVRFYDPSLQHDLDTRAMLENDLRRAIENDELSLHYQVQVDNERRLVGVEALLRWQHPTRGMIPPVKFIPVAEESMLIIELGDWVLHHACGQLALWSADPLKSGLTMAVNVSAHQFAMHDFVEHLSSVLQRHGIEPSKLKLELTEGVVLNDITDVVEKMRKLKVLGVQLSLDDFGTGYSSLAYLKKLPLDQLKIDQSFVRDITVDPGDAGMVQSIIDMAKNFRHDVIAEGVETEAQLSFLKHHACMAYQGYFFSKPVPLDELERLIADWKSD
ncbi:MAG: PAS domain S-box protein [Gammaproteobacteria bacterium]|nr:PAS domain S-box protein [Gammaproteobacteria bacterium]MBU1625694.1 PAS domain S-box protein [Gammaproteobacteria bacterium]MBU1980954.1 PAS domain S-box protein [Gammaproteobacteria bacterium]